MKLFVDKDDITALITDVSNIDQVKLNREIYDTQRFTFKNQLPAELYQAISDMLEENVRPWTRIKTYAIGEKVIRGEQMFAAIAETTGDVPEDSPNSWSEIKLYNVFRTYLLPFIVFISYSKYSVEHGLNASPHGYTKTVEESVQPISATERAMIVNKYQNRGDKYFLDFMSYMSENNNTIDSIQYSFSTARRNSPKIKFRGV